MTIRESRPATFLESKSTAIQTLVILTAVFATLAAASTNGTKFAGENAVTVILAVYFAAISIFTSDWAIFGHALNITTWQQFTKLVVASFSVSLACLWVLSYAIVRLFPTDLEEGGQHVFLGSCVFLAILFIHEVWPLIHHRIRHTRHNHSPMP